ncbi:MAG: nucleotidyltransferase family protein [Ideonella sp. WA131b]|jgi:molybdenum cofactor cytidylyltransferase|nr:nucleotidyltransferase family protein [Ideonella sp. WA131b]
MNARPTLIVPAAGRGSRFLGAGGPGHKLEQPLDGRTVLECTLRAALASQLPCLVVTTAELAPLAARQLARRDILVLSAGEAARGMGYSIAAGVAERSASAGWLVLPADMPRVRPASLQAVAASLAQQIVVFAQHQGRRGHPVGFAAELYSELVQLDGDDGARRIVARYPGVGVELDDPGVLQDVDTPGDLAALAQAAAKS